MKIVVGSTSAHKLNAVKQACAQIGLKTVISGVKTSSGQNEQPVGLDETLKGAVTRAKSAKTQHPDSIAIGIESGIFHGSGKTPTTLDIAVVVMLSPDGRRIVTTSPGIEFPEKYVHIAKERGFKTTTVGSVIAEKRGGDTTDPHFTLSNGRISRKKTLIDGITTALLQL